nr:hypothetical protein Iba_scaffold28737CG0010 [Ipomoea batatas]
MEKRRRLLTSAEQEILLSQKPIVAVAKPETEDEEEGVIAQKPVEAEWIQQNEGPEQEEKFKLEFLGWGSKRLIEFLDSIGKESRQYSQVEVDEIMKKLNALTGVIQSSGEPNLRLSNVEVEVPMSELSDRYFREKPVEAELEETPLSVSAEQKEKPPGRSDKTEGGEEEKEQKPVNQEPIVTGYEADHVEAPEGTSEEENVLMSQPNAREAKARANYTRRILRAACELSAAGLTFDEEDYVRFGGSNASAMHPNPARQNYLQEFSALMMNSVRAQAQQLQQQRAQEQQQQQQLQQQWAREQQQQQLQQQWARVQQQQQQQQQWVREQQQQQQLQKQWVQKQQQQQQLQQQWARVQQQQQWAREQQQQQQLQKQWVQKQQQQQRAQALQQLQQWVEAYQQQQSSIGRGGVTTILGYNRASSSTTQGLPGTAPEDPTTVIWLGADHRGYIEGPVSLNHLQIWLQQGYLGPDFRFLGWGSKPLIEFLDSIGKESRQYSQGEVDAIMKKYVASKNLIDPTNKRRIMCDEKLEKLLRRKQFLRKNVYHLLEVHFRENHDDDVDNAPALRY